MPSEKAKENKTLAATCSGCGKSVSVELARGVVTGKGRSRTIVSVCDDCYGKGWRPSSESAA